MKQRLQLDAPCAELHSNGDVIATVLGSKTLAVYEYANGIRFVNSLGIQN